MTDVFTHSSQIEPIQVEFKQDDRLRPAYEALIPLERNPRGITMRELRQVQSLILDLKRLQLLALETSGLKPNILHQRIRQIKEAAN